MEIDLNQAVDDIYKGQPVSPEAMQTIGKALLLSQQGQSHQQIAKELELSPYQVRQLVVRARGWELTQQSEPGGYGRYRD
jgi:predicted ArsR family transcriptional regulator